MKKVVCPLCGEVGYLHKKGCLVYVCHAGRTCTLKRELSKVPLDVKEAKKKIKELLAMRPMTRAELEDALGLPRFRLIDVMFNMKKKGEVMCLRLTRNKRGKKGRGNVTGATKLWGKYGNHNSNIYFLSWESFIKWALEVLPKRPRNVTVPTRKKMLGYLNAPEHVIDELARKWYWRDVGKG